MVAAKNIPQREQRIIEAQGALQGSLIGEPVRVEFNSEIYEPYFTYKGHGSYGTGTIVDLSGKISKTLKRHENSYKGPFSVDSNIEVKLPLEKFKHIKHAINCNGEIEEKKLQLNFEELLEWNDEPYKCLIEINSEAEKGSTKMILTLPNRKLETYTSNWYFNINDFKTKDLLKAGFSLAASSGSKLSVDVDGKKDLTDLNLHAALQTQHEKLKNVELSLKNKYVQAPKFEVDTDLLLIVDDKKTTVVSKLTPGIVPGLPNIDFTATYPQGKSRVFLFLQSKSKNDVSGKAELEWPTNGGGKLTASGKANYESAQNFRIEVDIDSAALKLNKWNILLANKPAKSAKTLQIVVKEDNAPIINGRLDYRVEDKENSYKAGVSGTVKVKETSQPLKAEVSFNKFTLPENGELGAEASLVFSLGQKSFIASSKYTNKESRAGVTYCYKTGTCSVAEAHSIFKSVDLTHLEHNFGAKIDLKASGIAEGFVLEGKTLRLPLSFDHEVELKLLNEKHTTYKLHSYLNEKSVGVVVTLPQRVIAAEGNLKYIKEEGERKLDLSIWLDKQKQPNNKASVHLLSAVNPTKDGTIIKGEVKISHPALQKDFAVTSKATLLNHDILLDATVDFDVFSKKNQKVILTAKLVRNQVSNGFNVTGFISTKGKIVDITLEGGAEVSTNGIGYNSVLTYKDVQQKIKEAQVLFQLTFTNPLVYVKSPTSDILKIEQQVASLPNGQKSIKEEVFVLGLQPLEIDGVINFPLSSKHTVFKKSTPDKKLEIDFLHDILTGFSVRVTSIAGGSKKDVIYIGLDLTDNNFLKTHFTWSTDELKRLVELAKDDTEAFLKKLKVVSHDLGEEVTRELQDVLESVKKIQPDWKAVISSYQNQLKTLREELENDEGFTGASENLSKFINAVTKAVVVVTKGIAEMVDRSFEDVNKLTILLQESFSKLLPKVKEFYIKVINLSSAVSSAVVETGSEVLLKLADFVKEHEDEIKKIVRVLQEFVEDTGKIVGKTVVQIRNEVLDFVRVLVDQVKALPVYGNIKEQYKHFVSQLSQHLLPEQAWAVIKDFVGGVKDSLPTEELRELIGAVEAYVSKHVNKETVNDVEELQLILNKALKALKSLLTIVYKQVPAPEAVEGSSFLGLRLPFALKAVFEFPKLVAFKFSPFLFVTSGGLSELPTLQEFIHTLRPTVNPLEWIPPYRAQGILIDLYHFITLDGRHFTFKGTCAYVLLQDIVDGNFSIAVDYASKSLVVSDQHESVEFFSDQTFKANGQPAEFPLISGNFKVWKDFGSVNLKHDAGLFISCKQDHNFCFFAVSGYYFGKTRGLLGTLDYEPWDDFKLPNGQVVSKVNDFGNSWKVNPSCGDVSGVTHHDHDMPEPPECTHVFGGSTPLRLGYFFVPSAPFREACSHIVADAATPEAKKAAACSTAAAYVTLVHSRLIFVSLPSDCVHCPVVSGPPVEVGDSVSVKVPQKAADIVIVVEQDIRNSEIFKELVTPLVTTLTNDLKAKGITDVHFTLIGFGDATLSHPAVYTAGGKINFEGKTKNIKFTEHADVFSLKLDNFENKVKYLKEFIVSELGLGAPSRAYQFASGYPFKIGTSKVLVGVVSSIKTSAFSVSIQQLSALYSTKVLRDRGVAFHVVLPVDDLQLTNKDAKTVKQIVGFDSHHVYLLSDAKKKVLEGSTELHNALTYHNNIWIPIALDSYGAAYVAQNFLDAKASARKQFLQVFSHRIAESLETELNEDCTCNLVSGLYPFSVCKVTNRKEREPLSQIRASKGGVKG
ncbi:hypothetical protein B7P43_G07271 [Cryptotermes secundus]|nr:hypothetical protein B7P43_G07271 [Cryptotermes secundus]PNF29923.1 hypothetical protein B7P43_G07271 [Cryptotermes secundus]